MALTVARTRAHTFIEFANPYLTCDECEAWVTAWHNDDQCGCDAAWWLEPCGHERAGSTSVCPSWGPVDGCQCDRVLGSIGHAVPPADVAEGKVL